MCLACYNASLLLLKWRAGKNLTEVESIKNRTLFQNSVWSWSKRTPKFRDIIQSKCIFGSSFKPRLIRVYFHMKTVLQTNLLAQLCRSSGKCFTYGLHTSMSRDAVKVTLDCFHPPPTYRSLVELFIHFLPDDNNPPVPLLQKASKRSVNGTHACVCCRYHEYFSTSVVVCLTLIQQTGGCPLLALSLIWLS